MTIKFRSYTHPVDYELIGNFLVEHYEHGNQDGNWLQPAWEYMHGHPYLDLSLLGKIGVWEDDGKLVAVTHYESQPGEAFFQFHPDYRQLKRDMLEHAENNLYGRSKDGKKFLCAFVNDVDTEFVSLIKARGYEKYDHQTRPMFQFVIPDPFPVITLPEGFRLKSLADDCNWEKIHRVLWRGFNHPGEAPEDEIEERKTMQDMPNFKHDLKIVVEAPDGNFVSFCGMWHEPLNQYAYVEPVATDPDFRRMGLGKAAVLEGIRRCSALGATTSYVANDLLFYQSIGFKKVFDSECWVKYLDE